MKKTPSWADDRAFYRNPRYSSERAQKDDRHATQQRNSIPKPPMWSNVKKKRTIGVFLNFEFGGDDELYHNFYLQAKRCSQYEMIDYSLNEAYRPDPCWLEKARKQIVLSDIVIVMVGQDTHNATGVEKKVRMAHRVKKPIFQVQPWPWMAGKVYGAGEVVPWEWKEIDAKIAEKLSE